jgi:hypothetical protein
LLSNTTLFLKYEMSTAINTFLNSLIFGSVSDFLTTVFVEIFGGISIGQYVILLLVGFIIMLLLIGLCL